MLGGEPQLGFDSPRTRWLRRMALRRSQVVRCIRGSIVWGHWLAPGADAIDRAQHGRGGTNDLDHRSPTFGMGHVDARTPVDDQRQHAGQHRERVEAGARQPDNEIERVRAQLPMRR